MCGYGAIGNVRAVASDDFDGNGVNDIAVADYNPPSALPEGKKIIKNEIGSPQVS
jgi:hypothetical protein